ncbi:MAG TPA: YaiI/YqxD family protein [Terricaulis sp.]|nr:YaiI/YqxD family protein [Terricaulis sp.]
MPATAASTIFVDADACPVKEEVYKVARRCGCAVIVVANAYMRTPPDVQFTLVDAGADVADDWIAERAQRGDIVITNDIPLADRALKAGALALGATGKEFTPASIGAALAQRELMEHLRSFGEGGGGPKPFSAADRSRFLSALDAAVHKAKKLR